MNLNSRKNIKKWALESLKIQADSISNLKRYIDEDFIKAVEILHHTTGRVIITGIGKSAIVANKIVATLNSTGTPAVFMHAADAIHGDLGIIQKNDVVICISKSGNSPEIKVLIPLLKQAKNKLIALTGNVDSYLAKEANVMVNTTVIKEACPNNLAPTSSTTSQMVMGDALAICLLQLKGFTSKDFAKYHPGGALGKRLYLKVEDLSSQHAKPQVSSKEKIKKVILEISSKRLGATAVVDNDKVLGIITDGDLRRMLEKEADLEKITAKDIMNKKPKTIDSNLLAVEAVSLMEKFKISQLLVLKENKYAGFIHMHDLLKEGLL